MAWVGVHYPDSDFNPVTLKAQIYRSCVNVPFAQKYNAPKILFYEKPGRTYRRADELSAGERQSPVDEVIDEGPRDDEADTTGEDQSDLKVGVEAQLRDYLAKNLAKLEQGLVFWQDSPPSVEYSIDGKRIDILAKDSEGVPVVVELKRDKAYDRVVGQALLYQALVAAKFKLSKVRVILVGNEITTDLRTACSRQTDFKLFEYQLTMQLNSVPNTAVEEEA